MFDSQNNKITYTNPLTDTINVIIGQLPPDKVTLSEIRDIIGKEGLLLLNVFLSLVFLIPVSIPGVSTIFGTAILLISICRLWNRRLFLPKCFQERQLPAEKLRICLSKGLLWFSRIDRFSRPHRLNMLINNRFINVLNNCAMVVGAALLMVPFGFVPFSNTLPAIALLFIAAGFMQRDGLYVLFGHLVNIATVFYFAAIVSGSGIIISKVIHRISLI